jgi:hypothetical protein
MSQGWLILCLALFTRLLSQCLLSATQVSRLAGLHPSLCTQLWCSNGAVDGSYGQPVGTMWEAGVSRSLPGTSSRRKVAQLKEKKWMCGGGTVLAGSEPYCTIHMSEGLSQATGDRLTLCSAGLSLWLALGLTQKQFPKS